MSSQDGYASAHEFLFHVVREVRIGIHQGAHEPNHDLANTDLLLELFEGEEDIIDDFRVERFSSKCLRCCADVASQYDQSVQQLLVFRTMQVQQGSLDDG